MRYVEQVYENPDVFEIEAPFNNISTHSTKCFVIESEGEWLVVDTGAVSQESEEHLFGGLAELGVDFARTQVFLTHLHLDHAGLANKFGERGCTVNVSAVDLYYAQPAGRAIVAADFAMRARAEGIPGPQIELTNKMQRSSTYFDTAMEHVNAVREGDLIACGARTFHVLETPGHTPGHVVLHDPEQRILFGGDHILFHMSPGIDLSPNDADTYQSYIDSLRKVDDLHLEKLFFSHGRQTRPLHERIEHLIAHHLSRADETCAYIASHPGTIGLDVIKGIRWNVAASSWEDIHDMQRSAIVREGMAVLDHLVATGRILRNESDDGIWRYTAA